MDRHSPNIALLLLASTVEIACGVGSTTLLYPMGTQAHSAEITMLASAPTAKTIVSGDFDGYIKAWNAADCSLLGVTQQYGMVSELALSSDGLHVAWFDRGGLKIGAVNSLSEAKKIPTQVTGGQLTFSRDSKALLVAGDQVALLDLTKKPPHERILFQAEGYPFADPKVRTAVLTPDEANVVVLNNRGDVFVISVLTARVTTAFNTGTVDRWTKVAFGERSPGHYYVAVGVAGGDISLSLIPEGRRIAILSNRGRFRRDRLITGLEFRVEDDQLLALDDEGTLTVWSLSSREPLKSWNPQAFQVYERPLVVGRQMAVAPTEPNHLRIYDLPSSEPKVDGEVKNVREIVHLQPAGDHFFAAGTHEIFAFDSRGELGCVCADGQVRQ